MRRRNPTRPMTACERGAWIDAEGSIMAYPEKGDYRIDITQATSEVTALHDYCEGARLDGVTCEVKRMAKKPWVSYVRIGRVEDVAKEIKLTKNWIRTSRKIAQIERFKAVLHRPKIRRRAEIIRAIKILEE